MDKIIVELQSYAEKHKTSKLSKTDTEAVVAMFKEMYNSHLEDQIPSAMIGFPSHVTSKSISEILTEMSTEVEQLEFLENLFRSKELDNYQGYLRQIDLFEALTPSFPGLSLYIVENLAQKVTEGATKVPSKGVLKKFPCGFVYETDLLSSCGHNLTTEQYSAIILLVVATLVERQSNAEEIRRVLSALSTANRQVKLTDNMKRKIFQDTKSWDTSAVSQLEKLGIVPLGMDISRMPSEVKVSYVPVEPKPVQSSESSRNHGNVVSLGASEFFETHVQELRRYVVDLEAKANQSHHVVDKLKSDNLALENRKLVTERKLAELQELVSRLTRENKDLKEEGKVVSEKLQSTVARLGESERRHEHDRHQLLDMTDRETQFVVEELKNKIRRRLKAEYADFREVESEEMTLALGENFRIQLNKVFSVLRNEGIAFDGSSIK